MIMIHIYIYIYICVYAHASISEDLTTLGALSDVHVYLDLLNRGRHAHRSGHPTLFYDLHLSMRVQYIHILYTRIYLLSSFIFVNRQVRYSLCLCVLLLAHKWAHPVSKVGPTLLAKWGPPC